MATSNRSQSGIASRYSSQQVKKVKDILRGIEVTSLAFLVLLAFLMPLGYGIVTSLKHENQITKIGSPLWPALERTFNYEGKDFSIYKVPTKSGIQEWALVKKGREDSFFIDPANPEGGLIQWEGRWRTLEPIWEFAPQWGNYPATWQAINFPQLLRNTLMYAVLSTIGAVSSAALVAYGFARFRIPRKNILFLIVMATIILPPAVTLIPTYAFFHRIGWVGTWLPLIVPAYFSNGYNIFLLRQFFLTLPRELDEAATIDGAGPFRIFISIILPNSKAALTAVTLFHFFYCWNDFFGPMIYLAGKPHLFPITVGITAFNNLYTGKQNYIQASALIALAVPLTIFFFAQRFFIQGIVITGVEK